MIEQTALEITKWDYQEISVPGVGLEQIISLVSFDVQRKRNSLKKGIAVRFTCHFTFDNKIILECSGEHSYVVDFEDVINKNELIKMIRNSYELFKEKYDFKKLNTILHSQSLQPLNESNINLDAILVMLM